MDDREKIKHLLEHWKEHNADHAKTYREWAKKADEFGGTELSGVLRQIAEETVKINDLFKKALSLI